VLEVELAEGRPVDEDPVRYELTEQATESMAEPNACRWCGDDPGHHGSQWVASVGLHQWEQPTQEQIKARMLGRRAARIEAGER
jgi:hypothetical protein